MVELGITAILLIVGLIFGSAREKKHFAELKKREAALLSRIPVRADKGPTVISGETFLVAGNVVIASDFFKNFVGQLRSFFGGRLSNQESLLDRARREATLRMREQALLKGATEIRNMRIETSFLDQIGIEIIAYGTAVK